MDGGHPEEPSQHTSDDAVVMVAGATGYVGRRLVPELLAAGHRVRCLARRPEELMQEDWADRVEVVRADVLQPKTLEDAFRGVRAAYYLIHSIGTTPDWHERDRRAAINFRRAAEQAGTRQIIYLGGLGDAGAGQLSPHLASRHEVGAVLAAGTVPVTELRAAVVIGSGSASFEMLRHLTEMLPAMVCPRWVDTRCQPIGIRDLLVYAVGVLDDPEAQGAVVEVGGADVVTYREMMRLYAQVAGLRRRLVVSVPVLSPRLSSLWIGLVTPLPPALARPLVDSLVNEVVVTDDLARRLVEHEPMTCREAIELAVRRVADLEVATTWADAQLYGSSPADPMPSDPQWSGGTVLEDDQRARSVASPSELFRVVEGIGGARGWPSADWMWRLRGLADQLLGGIGMRRGRRHPDRLRVGDALDFWRVEALERPVEGGGGVGGGGGGLLRLRAEMKVPGEAWLEWRVEPTDDGGALLHQRARFHPRGLWGRAYWYALLPFHRVVFAPMARTLVERADGGARADGPRDARPALQL
jgi:uncharacterized protein YbjT (DUF2867 family)